MATGGFPPGRFFVNEVNEGGVFVERAVQYNLDGDGRGRMASWLDFDDDGRTDVLLARVARLITQALASANISGSLGLWKVPFKPT